jgi:hypothetical protein
MRLSQDFVDADLQVGDGTSACFLAAPKVDDCLIVAAGWLCINLDLFFRQIDDPEATVK